MYFVYTKKCIYIYIRLKIKPNSVRIRFQSCQIFVLPSTGFEPTPLIHCSTIRLALRPAPQTTRPHPLPKPNSVRIRFLSCQIFVLPSTGFGLTPLIHCSTIRLALCTAPQTTRPHPLPIKGASIIVVLPFLVRQIQGQT